MFGAILLAWRYLTFEKGRTCLLFLAISVTAAAAPAVQWTIVGFERQTRQRADSTPLVVGAPGSRFSLVIQTLYFQGETLPRIAWEQVDKIRQWQRGEAIPLYVRYRAQGFPIVGTSGEYFELRQLSLASGEPLARYGDCLIGADVAVSLGLKPGDRILTDPENAFDLSGPSALNMRVQGVLNRTHSQDDLSIFCSLETTWIIEGLGHGHASSEPVATSGPAATSGPVGGDAQGHRHAGGEENLQRYAEVTDANAGEFHFHGSREKFPITSIIVVPDSEKSSVILMGKFLEPDAPCQIVSTGDTVDELMLLIGRARRAVDLGAAAMTAVSLMLVVLVLSLSLKLRRGELLTLKRLGAGRFDIVRMLAVEYTLVAAVGIGVGLLAAYTLSGWAVWWLRSLL